MTLNSFPFFALFFITAVIYYCLKNTGQKLILLIAGYVFYMWLRPAYGVLLLGSTLFSYFCARATQDGWLGRRRLWTAVGAAAQLGMLFVFKYTNFFLESILGVFGLAPETPFLTLALPVGISFFTFAITGYLFDVCRGRMEAERSILDYAVFVAFFPSLLSGPIGRAREFLPQMKERRAFSRAGFKWGLMRFVWGMVQKMVVADTLAIMVNTAYSGEVVISAGTWIFVVLIYSFQLYFDFAGYSSMAIGAAKALGIELMENFDSPFYSTSVRSFWKKWHISLTSWLKENVYFPLGGSRRGKWRTCFNILVVYVVSGLWHGAAWTYIVWAFLNGLAQVIESLLEPAFNRALKFLRISPKNKLLMLAEGLFTFAVIALIRVFFRAESIAQARFVFGQLAGVFVHGAGGVAPTVLGVNNLQLAIAGFALALCMLGDALRLRGHNFRRLSEGRVWYYAVFAAIVVFVSFFGVYGEGFDPQAFIYFQY